MSNRPGQAVGEPPVRAVSVGGRTGRHEELGVLSFNRLLNEFAFHDLGHMRQVIELYRARALYPNMGVSQSYYKIHP